MSPWDQIGSIRSERKPLLPTQYVRSVYGERTARAVLWPVNRSGPAQPVQYSSVQPSRSGPIQPGSVQFQSGSVFNKNLIFSPSEITTTSKSSVFHSSLSLIVNCFLRSLEREQQRVPSSNGTLASSIKRFMLKSKYPLRGFPDCHSSEFRIRRTMMFSFLETRMREKLMMMMKMSNIIMNNLQALLTFFSVIKLMLFLNRCFSQNQLGIRIRLQISTGWNVNNRARLHDTLFFLNEYVFILKHLFFLWSESLVSHHYPQVGVTSF